MTYNINRRRFLQKMAAGAAAVHISRFHLHAVQSSQPEQVGDMPNIILLLADDLGYGDIGYYGQKKFQTPNIDKMAGEGIRFTQFYSGSTICAPSRSVLMTGQHTGHTRVRGNTCIVGGSVGYKGKQQVRRMYLTDEDRTVGHVLQKAGYRTCLVGKWHLDGFNPKAGPMDRGFDEFYGWLISASETGGYYPAKRYRNRQLYDVPGNSSRQRIAEPERDEKGSRGYYEPDMCTDEAIAFIKTNRERPFFLYLAYNSPHSPLQVSDLGPYKDKDWPEHIKTYAAMVHGLDQNVGKVIQTLRELQLDRKTIIFFSSDNGPRSEPTRQLTEVADFFDSNGPLRGYKRDLYEGGIRVPMIARWPGKVPSGKTSDVPWYFADFLPAAAELAGAEPLKNIDGLSIIPVLLGQKQDLGDRFMYWEFFEGGFQQAVRCRNWKAIRLKQGQPLALFDLSADLGEQNNVADKHPEVIAQIEKYLKTVRTESPEWPLQLVKNDE
jgi:arylsulfatase A-like enzyme